MKYLSLLFLASFFAYSGSAKISNHSGNLNLLQNKFKSILDHEMAEYMKKYPDYPGGIALQVLVKGKSHFATSQFMTTVTDQYHFRAASNTKTFTAAAILLLHQQGKLNIKHCLTDTIPNTNELYLPDMPLFAIPHKSSISIHDLLRHRAGVFDVTNDPVPDSIDFDLPYKGHNYLAYMMRQKPNHDFTPDELIGVVAAAGLSYFEPGKGYHYSNTGYSILARIIERVSRQPYDEYLLEHIIQPMGLTNTHIPVMGHDQEMPHPFLPGYFLENGNITDVTLSNISGNIAEGNIITTLSDLSRFIRTLLRGEGPLSSYTIHSFMMNAIPVNTNTNFAYGCGLSYTNGLGYGHNGAHKGYLSLMVYDPEADISIVMVTNTWNFNRGFQTIYEQLQDFMLNIAFNVRLAVIEN